MSQYVPLHVNRGLHDPVARRRGGESGNCGESEKPVPGVYSYSRMLDVINKSSYAAHVSPNHASLVFLSNFVENTGSRFSGSRVRLSVLEEECDFGSCLRIRGDR